MQKTKKNPAAGKAVAGTTGKAAKPRVRKPLTPEQRKRKNERDRERRAKLRKVHDNKQSNIKCTKQHNSGKKCEHKCAGNCDIPRFKFPKICEVASNLFGDLGRQIVEQMKQVKVKPAECESVQVEPGVVQHFITLPSGRKALVTVVDGSKVDPLSDYSPVPYQIRRQLLLDRMAQEISDIVDASIAALS